MASLRLPYTNIFLAYKYSCYHKKPQKQFSTMKSLATKTVLKFRENSSQYVDIPLVLEYNCNHVSHLTYVHTYVAMQAKNELFTSQENFSTYINSYDIINLTLLT